MISGDNGRKLRVLQFSGKNDNLPSMKSLYKNVLGLNFLYGRKLTQMVSDLLRADLKPLLDPKSAHATNS